MIPLHRLTKRDQDSQAERSARLRARISAYGAHGYVRNAPYDRREVNALEALYDLPAVEERA